MVTVSCISRRAFHFVYHSICISNAWKNGPHLDQDDIQLVQENLFRSEGRFTGGNLYDQVGYVVPNTLPLLLR